MLWKLISIIFIKGKFKYGFHVELGRKGLRPNKLITRRQ